MRFSSHAPDRHLPWIRTLFGLTRPRPNNALQLTPYSVRYAPASGHGSPPAFGCTTLDRWISILVGEELVMAVLVLLEGIAKAECVSELKSLLKKHFPDTRTYDGCQG